MPLTDATSKLPQSSRTSFPAAFWQIPCAVELSLAPRAGRPAALQVRTSFCDRAKRIERKINENTTKGVEMKMDQENIKRGWKFLVYDFRHTSSGRLQDGLWAHGDSGVHMLLRTFFSTWHVFSMISFVDHMLSTSSISSMCVLNLFAIDIICFCW